MGEQILRSLGVDECGLLREPRTWTLSLAREIARQDEVGNSPNTTGPSSAPCEITTMNIGSPRPSVSCAWHTVGNGVWV